MEEGKRSEPFQIVAAAVPVIVVIVPVVIAVIVVPGVVVPVVIAVIVVSGVVIVPVVIAVIVVPGVVIVPVVIVVIVISGVVIIVIGLALTGDVPGLGRFEEGKLDPFGIFGKDSGRAGHFDERISVDSGVADF